ncbi:hypothetical protein diail_9819, partial [Diaporthe ilicicola]
MAFLARGLTALSLVVVSIGGSANADGSSDGQDCRNLPGDTGWPSQTTWSRLNATLDGQLIATVPQADVCHTTPYNDYDPTACAKLQSTWAQAETYVERPAEFMNPYYQNQSCDPFTPASRTCQLGNYAAYSINVMTAQHVIAGFDFARQNNVRLVAKTTGHDFMGKSTGKGALSLWMYSLKDKAIIHSYSNPSSTYTGLATATGLVGGYSQGGGHSLLGGAYGMAADNVLEWEVVTPQGEHLVATPSSNPDLYWAISGGGGGTFGVVMSMTVKIHPDGQVASGGLTVNLAGAGSAGDNETAFWLAVEHWFQSLPLFLGLDNANATAGGPRNATTIVGMTNSTFYLLGITFPDQTTAQLEAALAPYLAQLDALDFNYTFTTTQYDSYLQAFNSTKNLGPLPWGRFPTTEVWASRLVPASLVRNATAVSGLVSVYRAAVQNNTFSVGCNVLAGAGAPAHPDNADFAAPLDENLAFKRELVSAVQPAVEAATPGTGVYLNEIDPWYKGDWKTEMYGVNYERLLNIKH